MIKNPHDILQAPFDPDGGGGGGGSSSSVSEKVEMTTELASYLGELQGWAEANRKDAHKDWLAFWSLKVPAIVSSTGAGILAYIDIQVVSLVLGFVAGTCVAIDGIYPRGTLRNVHKKAEHDILNLRSDIKSAWRTRSLAANPQNMARNIIKNSQTEHQRIAHYLRDAESSLNETATG